MAVKTITITEEAYRKLARLKKGGESFTDVINRVLGGPSTLRLAGALSPDVGDAVAREVKRLRKDLDRAVASRWKA
jgi:predicted CopG family antitoxin